MPPNFAHQTMWTGDNLPILRGMNSDSVDLIYADPPFNSKANYAAPVGSQAAGAAFKDTWGLSDVDAEWVNLIEAKHPRVHRVLLAAMTDGDKAYLVYMAARLLELRRVLKASGSIYLHCDPTMSHYLKLLMDAVFGRANFRNEVIWQRHRGFKRRTAKQFTQKNDSVLFYAKSVEHVHFQTQFVPHKPEYVRRFRKDADGRLYRDDVNPTRGGRRRIYLDETDGDIVDNVWIDIPPVNPNAKERVGYPTQKPLALLKRMIAASAPPNGMVLDPFCGCATACIAAEQLGRQWIGIDISPKAAELVTLRMRDELGLFYQGTVRRDIPRRTDLGPLPTPRSHRNALYGEQGGDCAGCGEHFRLANLEVDHIVARAAGGTDHVENLQLLCGACNRVKGDRGMAYLRVKLGLA
ncbi:MAG: DNA methyltransferase [Chloroflexi bacterium]|nr:DNA methyltransferase [Chloroflexota bacterium]